MSRRSYRALTALGLAATACMRLDGFVYRGKPVSDLNADLMEGSVVPKELREELTQLFAAGDSTVVYATTEPGEALLLGGYTAVLDQGELLQYGPTAEVFHRPKSLRVARAFSDPPMNLLAADVAEGGAQLQGGPLIAVSLPREATRSLTLGIRASAVRVAPRPGDVALAGQVEELARAFGEGIAGSPRQQREADRIAQLLHQEAGRGRNGRRGTDRDMPCRWGLGVQDQAGDGDGQPLLGLHRAHSAAIAFTLNTSRSSHSEKPSSVLAIRAYSLT